LSMPRRTPVRLTGGALCYTISPMWIITGGAGFIGSALIWKLNQAGLDDILVVDRLETSEKWKNLRKRRFRDYLEADPFLAQLAGHRFGAVVGIVHLGACSSTTETN